jgi:predicted nucleic acid-binding protein
MIALDTNVVVAALSEWHDHHARSAPVLDRLLAGNERFLVPSQALREAYAVITRMPRELKRTPEDAYEMLRSLVTPCEIVDVHLDTWALLERAAQLGAVSGQIHDAHLAHVAASAGAKTLLTWNVRHMRLVAPTGLDVREP